MAIFLCWWRYMCLKMERCSKIVSNGYFINKRVRQLGISPKFMGLYYLIDIMDILINEERKVKSFSREVYPALAEKYERKSCSVERDIRFVIKKFWDDRLKERLADFWTEDKRPKCCEFISTVRDYVMKDII